MPQLQVALQRWDRVQGGTISSLLSLMLENVIQAAHQHPHHLEFLPHIQHAHSRGAGHGHQRVEPYKSADRDLAADYHGGPCPEEKRRREQANDLDDAVVRHHNEVPMESLS